MNFINSWKSAVKQADKLNVTLRISLLTIFELNIDISKKNYKITILNIGLEL